MGVAIASGVPPALGLITGIVGGLVVGMLAGSPLQVSGPAAGLAVLVLAIVQEYGLHALGVAVLIAGTFQTVAGLLRFGRWFRAVSPAVIQGMLAGIGVLIFARQIHVMFDAAPRGNGLADLIAIPESIGHLIFQDDGSKHIAGQVGILAIATLVLWERFRPAKFKAIPGALICVFVATTVAAVFALPIQYVEVPNNLLNALNVPTAESWALLSDRNFWVTSIALGLIASAEALLCATAVDRLHHGVRTQYDRELFAQGIGNLVCGVFGAPPATGVIVRSKANLEAGATSRWSAVAHGGWLFLFVVAFPGALQLVPLTALAAILVFIGYRLLNPASLKARWQESRSEFFIYAVTVVGIVSTDLLTGVLLGFACALLKLIYIFTHLSVHVEDDGDERVDVDLEGAATFVRLPYLAQALESLPQGKEVHIHLGGLAYIDHACMEQLRQWQEGYEVHAGSVVVEWDMVHKRGGSKMLLHRSKPKPTVFLTVQKSIETTS